jgi:hypothetical protein
MNRRNFLSRLGLAALAVPFAGKVVAEPKPERPAGVTHEQRLEAIRKLTAMVSSVTARVNACGMEGE